MKRIASKTFLQSIQSLQKIHKNYSSECAPQLLGYCRHYTLWLRMKMMRSASAATTEIMDDLLYWEAIHATAN